MPKPPSTPTLLPRRGRRGEALPLPRCGRGIEGEGNWPGTSRRHARLVPRLRAATLAESGLITGAPSTRTLLPRRGRRGERSPSRVAGGGSRGREPNEHGRLIGRPGTRAKPPSTPTLLPRRGRKETTPPPPAEREGERGGGHEALWWAERPRLVLGQSTGTTVGLSCSCGRDSNLHPRYGICEETEVRASVTLWSHAHGRQRKPLEGPPNSDSNVERNLVLWKKRIHESVCALRENSSIIESGEGNALLRKIEKGLAGEPRRGRGVRENPVRDREERAALEVTK